MQHNSGMSEVHQEILSLVRSHGVIRARDLGSNGLPRMALTRMVRRGELVRVGRGLYTTPDHQYSENTNLAAVAKMYPKAVVCLLSALRFHNLTTQSPHAVWLGIPNKARPPKLDYPPVRIIRFSGRGLTDGIETHRVERVPVRITSISRSVVDCFKFRNKIGLDVALDALQEAWRERRVTMDDLWGDAQNFRVANVMRPYLESLQ